MQVSESPFKSKITIDNDRGYWLLKHIRDMTPEACARAWHDLNHAKWPGNIPENLKPSWWDDSNLSRSDRGQRKMGLWSVIGDYLANVAGQDLLRKVHDEIMNASEF